MSNSKHFDLERIGRGLELPAGAMTNSVNMEIHSNKEVIIDGKCTIIEYTDSVIRFNVHTGVVKISGDRLRIRTLTSDNAIITGIICSIEFTD